MVRRELSVASGLVYEPNLGWKGGQLGHVYRKEGGVFKAGVRQE